MSEEQKTQADASGGLDALFRKTLDNHQVEPSEGTCGKVSAGNYFGLRLPISISPIFQKPSG